jgi:hypothetical protein
VSRLADQRKGRDDYPDAATKHLADAEALDRAGRPDGCFYVAGYVVECALKSVLLHEESWDSGTKTHVAKKLNAALDRLQTPNHDLLRLLAEITAMATARTAKYVPKSTAIANVGRWKPSVRYRGPSVPAADSKRVLDEAKLVYSTTIKQMILDGVL